MSDDSKNEKEEAAVLIAQGLKSLKQIAEYLQISVTNLNHWRLEPGFRERVLAIKEEWRAQLSGQGLADIQERVDAYNDRWARMKAVIAARSEDLADVPGGETGLLTRHYKSLGGGQNFEVVTEYEVDTALLREMRELEKHAAIDLGQWSEKHEISGNEDKPLGVVIHLPERIPWDPSRLIQKDETEQS